MYTIEYINIEKNEQYEIIIEKVLKKCFEIEKLPYNKLLISITLTNEDLIQKLNKQYRNIDRPTDVLSFPIFSKEEIEKKIRNVNLEYNDILGDVVISIPQIKSQAIEYGHSFERELSYMVVHSFYHLLGYDHIKEEDKALMRPKEENVLNELKKQK